MSLPQAHAFVRGIALVIISALTLRGATALPEFAFREFTVAVTQADGRPAANVSLYGFCPELNLLWPRHDSEWQGRNDIVWHERYLATTGADGRVKVIVPPGKWGFFAAGRVAGGIVVAWSDFAERPAGTTISLTPKVTKKWELSSPRGGALSASRVFFKPENFPIAIGAVPDPANDTLSVQMSKGAMELHASGHASTRQSAFALAFGSVSDTTVDGLRSARGEIATIACSGGSGRAVLLWQRHDAFGLEGEMTVSDPADVMFTSGAVTLAYRRPVAGLTGRFVGHRYTLDPSRALSLNFDGPLAAGLDQDLEKADKKGQRKLAARVYLVDRNGHLLAEATDATGAAPQFHASVSIGGRRIPAQISTKGEIPGQGEGGQGFFEANVGAISEATNAMWESMRHRDCSAYLA